MTDLVLRQSSRNGGELVVHVTGEIDGATAPSLEQTLLAAVASAPHRLLIDASAVSFCDSRGIAALIAAWRAADSAGVPLTVRPSPRLLRVLTLSGVDTLLDLT